MPANSCVLLELSALRSYSDSLLDEVGAHLSDKSAAVLHVLGAGIAIDLVLLPHADNDSSGGLANNGAATGAGKLSDGLIIGLVGEHELGLTHADTSLAGLSVAIRGAHSAGDFVNLNGNLGAIHLLKLVIVSGKITTLVAGNGPESTVLAVDSGSIAHSGDGPVVGLVIESVDHLIGVSLPVSHFL